MGLDVYLYRYENKTETDRLKGEYERASDQNWKRFGDKQYEHYSEAEKASIRASNVAVAERLGLNADGDDPREQKIELNSATYPDHLFKIGYFRSSYNDGGINRILDVRIGATLYTLFGIDQDEYEVQPDWAEARRRTVAALEQLRAANQARPFRAASVGPNMFGGSSIAKDEVAALAIFERVRTKHSSGAFSSCDGEFWLSDPLPVRAAIAGRNALGSMCMYLVYEDNAENMQWYERALEIMIETCDYVLAQPDRDKYWMHWSG